jgi:hypothetical protein
MTQEPDKAPNTGEPTPMNNEEFRREASAFLSDKPEPTFTPEPTDRPEPKAPWEKKSSWNADASPEARQPKERRSILFPAALILLGGLALAYNFGLVQANFWYWLSRLWPIWLIVAGLDIVISRRKRWFGWVMLGLVVTIVSGAIWGGQTIWDQVNATGRVQVGGVGESTPVTYMREDAKEAEVRLSPGIAQLVINATSSDESLVNGTVYSPPGLQARTSLERAGDRAIFSVSQRDTSGIHIGSFQAQPWDLQLTPKIPLRLTIDGGVGRSDLDLRELQVTYLSVKTGVGETQITLPASGKLTGRIDAGVGKVVVRIPRSMGAQITTSTGIGGVGVHGTFDQNGHTYTTQGYAQSANQADLSINGGVGAIEIELID